MLGSDSTHAGCYQQKHSNDFPSHKAVSRSFQLFILAGLVVLNIFFMLLCMSYGLHKGREWQVMWAVAVLLKVFIELAVTPFIESLVLDYGLPSLIKRDILLVIHALLASSKRIVNDKKCFHLNQFSSTDYLHASSLLAREMPDLLEAKIVLMYRDTLPDRLVQGRAIRMEAGKKRSRGSIKHSLILSVVTTLVYISSLDGNIQRVLVYSIPGTFFVLFGFLLVTMTPFSFVALLVGFVLLFLVGPKILHSVSRALFPDFYASSFAARDRRLTREHSLVLPMTSVDLTIGRDMDDTDGVLKPRQGDVRPAKGTTAPSPGFASQQSWWQKSQDDVVSDDSDDPDSHKVLLMHIKVVESGTQEEDKKAVEEETMQQAAITAAELATMDGAVQADEPSERVTVILSAMEEGVVSDLDRSCGVDGNIIDCEGGNGGEIEEDVEQSVAQKKLDGHAIDVVGGSCSSKKAVFEGKSEKGKGLVVVNVAEGREAPSSGTRAAAADPVTHVATRSRSKKKSRKNSKRKSKAKGKKKGKTKKIVVVLKSIHVPSGQEGTTKTTVNTIRRPK